MTIVNIRMLAVIPVLLLAGCNTCYLETLLLPETDPAARIAPFQTNAVPTEVPSSGDTVYVDETLFEQIPGRTGHHAPTITCFGDGELLASWFSFSGEHELEGSAILMSRKRPGQPWETPWLHMDRPSGDGNPVLYSEGDRVWFFQAVVPFGWSTSTIATQQSTDRGRTWSAPSILSAWPGSNTRYPPIRLDNGMLLLPAYDDLLSRSVFFASWNGEDWCQLSGLSSDPPCIQPSVVQLDNGQLLSVMRNKGGSWLWFSVSDDYGRSWSDPADSGFANPGSAAALLRLRDGVLALVFNDSTNERTPLSISLSADQGRSWPAKKVLASGSEAYAYPSAVQTPDGLIHIVYSVSKNQIRHVVVNEAWIVVPETPSDLDQYTRPVVSHLESATSDEEYPPDRLCRNRVTSLGQRTSAGIAAGQGLSRDGAL